MNEKELAIEQVRVAQLLLASYEEDETLCPRPRSTIEAAPRAGSRSTGW
jgi:hypothetical protein